MSDVINYMDFATESSIESLKLMNKHRLVHLSLESEFIIECMEAGVLSPVMEAEDKASSIFGRVKDAIAKFFKRVLGLFRDRSKEKAEKYVPWIKENMKSIKERSKNMTIELSPYWKSDWRDDIKQMTTTANKIFENIKNEKFEDYTFANDLVKLDKNVTDTPNLKDRLVVRFSIGEDKTKIEQVKVEKFGNTDTIDGMLEYIINYASEVPNALNQLEKDIERKLDQVSPKTLTIKESQYFDIEESVLCETDLVTLINYMEVITEAGKEPKDKGTVNSEGEETSDTSVKVNPDGNEGEGTPEQNQKDGKEGESNEAKTTYISQCESFLKTMVTAFLTAAEKRFVVYTNTMVAIGGASGNPAKDEDGNVEDKEKENKPEEENPKEKKESLVGKIKNKVKNVANTRAKAKKKESTK